MEPKQTGMFGGLEYSQVNHHNVDMLFSDATLDPNPLEGSDPHIWRGLGSQI